MIQKESIIEASIVGKKKVSETFEKICSINIRVEWKRMMLYNIYFFISFSSIPFAEFMPKEL